MKLFIQVFGPTILIPKYLLGSKKPNMNTTTRSNYLNSILIPNYLSHPLLEQPLALPRSTKY